MQTMTSRRAIYFFYALLAVFGVISGLYEAQDRQMGKAVEFAFSLGLLILIYAWYYFDASEMRYRRTSAMGASIILCSVLAVPFYLYRSRPSGTRAKAFIKLIGGIALLIVVPLVTALPFALLSNAS